MASITVASRFACLKVDDDEVIRRPPPATSRKVDPKKDTKSKNGQKSQSSNKQNPKKNKKVKQQTDKQWQEWKDKDSEIVNDNYEQDLQSAIMQSKLDFEEKKELYEKYKRETEEAAKKSDGKKKKNKAMSLEQFLASQNIITANIKDEPKPALDKDNFFDKVKEDAKVELNKDFIEEKRKERDFKIDENITIAQIQVKLDEEREINRQLRLDLEKSRKDITDVKSRNKTLCAILGQGEMKDKAGVLLELEKLNTVKDELTQEVGRLHVLLEQERSKNVPTNDTHNNKHKEKAKK